MGTVWRELRMNHPVYLAGAVLLVAAVWLVARPHRRSPAAVWAAVAVGGFGLTHMLGLLEATFRQHPPLVYRTGVAVAGCGLVGLLFAAVLADRRPGGGDG